VNIVDRIDLEIETFKAANNTQPTRMKLGRTQVRALNAFRDRYSSHPDRNAGGRVSPNYEGIPIEEISAEDQLDLE
jgi:hypothetical protein